MNSVLTMAVNDSPITAVKTKQPLIAFEYGDLHLSSRINSATNAISSVPSFF